jgi:hypothetical protein
MLPCRRRCEDWREGDWRTTSLCRASGQKASQLGRGDTRFVQHSERRPLRFYQNAQQQVRGMDLARSEVIGFNDGVFDDSLGVLGERDFDTRRESPPATLATSASSIAFRVAGVSRNGNSAVGS